VSQYDRDPVGRFVLSSLVSSGVALIGLGTIANALFTASQHWSSGRLSCAGRLTFRAWQGTFLAGFETFPGAVVTRAVSGSRRLRYRDNYPCESRKHRPLSRPHFFRRLLLHALAATGLVIGSLLIGILQSLYFSRRDAF
jgi:hypothetical protein